MKIQCNKCGFLYDHDDIIVELSVFGYWLPYCTRCHKISIGKSERLK